MRENLFEIGAKFDDGWSSDNKNKVKSEQKEIKEPNKHSLYFVKEKRRGKIITIVQPFFLEDKKLKELLKKLKTSLGCGGTVKNDTIELQGEVTSRVKEFLQSEGFRFKK